MKKIISNVTSFVLGASLFVAGSAFATEDSSDQNQSFVEPTPVVAESATAFPEPVVTESAPVQEAAPVQEDSAVSSESAIQWLVTSDNPVFCWNIGKTNELDRDCFCVEGSVTTMDEVDCLIESGVVGADTREVYREQIELNN